MNMTKLQRILSFVLCMVLIAAVALFTFGCNEQGNDGDGTTTAGETTTGETTVAEKTFTFIVVDGAGVETSFTITTEKKLVGEALMDEGLLEGEDGPYGLYVKKVNGIVADYDVDGTYWAFYINGSYAMSGVDTTEIEDGATYSFKVEK